MRQFWYFAARHNTIEEHSTSCNSSMAITQNWCSLASHKTYLRTVNVLVFVLPLVIKKLFLMMCIFLTIINSL